MTNTFETTIVAFGIKEHISALVTYLGSANGGLDFNSILPITAHTQCTKHIQSTHRIRRNCPTCGILNWGTKWNCVNVNHITTIIDDTVYLSITFETIGSEPNQIIDKIFADNRSVRFLYSTCDNSTLDTDVVIHRHNPQGFLWLIHKFLVDLGDDGLEYRIFLQESAADLALTDTALLNALEQIGFGPQQLGCSERLEFDFTSINMPLRRLA